MNSHRSLPGDPPRWLPWVIALGLLAGGAFIPLMDPDLPAHLSVGEWIVRHHAVPYVEPFAWTRAGAPYFAYSWLAQSTYFLVLRGVGSLGLQALHGLVLAAAFLAVYALGRAAGWRPWATLAVAIGNVWMLFAFAAYLRPQAVLLILGPLAWAFGYRLLDGTRRWWPPALGLFAVSALAANTHLFFILTALPWWLLLVRPLPRAREERLRAVVLVVVPIAGWLATPYALAWPAVFRLFFAPNPLMRWPSIIDELRPGVLVVPHAPDLAICTALLLALPWVATRPGAGLSTRERVVLAILWTIGLLGFAGALRLAIVWWLAVLPWTGVVFNAIPDAESIGIRAARATTAIVIALAPVAPALKPPPPWFPPARGVIGPRTIPTMTGAGTEPLAAWLDAHAPGRHGKILTTFNYGSYLLWRLPSYSVSIDSRGIFPDSVLESESFHGPISGPRPLGPWRSADIVIIPRSYELASVLDTAAGWKHVADAPNHDSTARKPGAPPALITSPGLWVRERWLNGVERAQ